MIARRGSLARICLGIVLGMLVLLTLVAGYALSGEDARRLRVFAQTTASWRQNPEFRSINDQYVQLGSESLRTRCWWLPSGDVLLALRKVPGLPRRWAASDSLQLHYRKFALGPLWAYLHLLSEQGMADAVAMVENLARQPEGPSDESVKAMLRSFDTWPPVVADAGAVASVRRLLADVGVDRPITIREPVADRLMPHIRAVARRKGFPEDPRHLDVGQQRVVLSELDEQVRGADLELWRAKQVNDFLNGVWGHTFGSSYGAFAHAVLIVRSVCRVLCPVLVVVITWIATRRRSPAGIIAAGEDSAPQAAHRGGPLRIPRK